MVWGYGVLGSLFTTAPTEYQWLLVIPATFAKDFFAKLLSKVTMKAAGGQYEQNKKTIKFLVQHYITMKHTVFLAVIVGSVATPASSYFIMAVDFAKAMQSGWKIVKKYKTDPNVEGNQSCI